jgi:sulfate adenylyltransferase subunit 2
VTTTHPPHLRALEAESIHILRELAAQAARPVLLYSIGKDSSVLLHLARKAFFPAPPPFPLLHIDTTWKFRDMITFRDAAAKRFGFDLRVHTNPEGLRQNINPFDHGSNIYTQVMKTDALKQALTEGRYDVAIGGARRDEERSRAKERVFSVRGPGHSWDPKRQRPELWHLYNGNLAPGETLRVFPLSNWTELDVWSYILAEGIDVVPLYFAARRWIATARSSWSMTIVCSSGPARRRSIAWCDSAHSAAIRCRRLWNHRRPTWRRSSRKCAPRACRSARGG